MYVITTACPVHRLTTHTHIGRNAYASHARNSQKQSIQNNKDVLMASSPSNQRKTPLQHQSPRVGKTVRKQRALNERLTLLMRMLSLANNFFSQRRRRAVARRKQGQKSEEGCASNTHLLEDIYPYVTCTCRVLFLLCPLYSTLLSVRPVFYGKPRGFHFLRSGS